MEKDDEKKRQASKWREKRKRECAGRGGRGRRGEGEVRGGGGGGRIGTGASERGFFHNRFSPKAGTLIPLPQPQAVECVGGEGGCWGGGEFGEVKGGGGLRDEK